MSSKNQTTGASSIQFIFYLAVVSLICIGCGQGNSIKLSSTETKAFEGAAPEIKKAWEGALAADKANDYVAAQTCFSNLGQMVLDNEQQRLLGEERAAFGQRLMQAAEKNDPAAIQAVQMALKSRNRR